MKSANIIRRTISIFMVLVMLIAAVPVCFAEGTRFSSVTEVMKKFSGGVKKPKETCLLDNPVEMTVASEHGNFIYTYSSPRTGKRLGKAEEGATVVVYAKQGGYALGLVKGTSIGGWMDELKLEGGYTPLFEEGESYSLTEIMGKFDNGIQKPKASAVLDEAEAMIVNSKHGININIYTAPRGKTILKALEAQTVIVLARQDGYALVMVDGTSIGGWAKEELLAFD